MTVGARHLYVHLPFCAHRCGYCDFVTVVGRSGSHDAYVDALLRELDLERDVLADSLETVYLGGGTPTFTEPDALARLLDSLPPAAEVTVEANPETLTPNLARRLADGVEPAELSGERLAREDVHGHALVLAPEEREQQPHLEAVARRVVVVEPHPTCNDTSCRFVRCMLEQSSASAVARPAIISSKRKRRDRIPLPFPRLPF